MIGFKLSDIIGGEPIGDVDMSDLSDEAMATEVKLGDVFHVRTAGGKVLEKVVADNATEALDKAKELLGDVKGLFVTGPHETGVNAAPSSEG